MEPWPSRNCTVARTEASAACKPENDNYRVTVFMEPFTNSPSVDVPITIPAYVDADPEECTFPSEADATNFLRNYSRGALVTCYTDGTSIRLTLGGKSGSEIDFYRLRAVLPIVSAIFVGLILVFLVMHIAEAPQGLRIFHLRPPAADLDQERTFDEELDDIERGYPTFHNTNTTPTEVWAQLGRRRTSKKPLTRNEALLLVNSFAESSQDESVAAKAACPICLDDISLMPCKRVVCLPCKHHYHEECVLEWFRKGGATCPYCNYNLNGDLYEAKKFSEKIKKHEQQHDELEAQNSSSSRSTSVEGRPEAVDVGEGGDVFVEPVSGDGRGQVQTWPGS